ncbi:MAG: prenyltransferase/squalene oxidase repeat-containing protein [Gemmataceae bacterium]
MRRRDFLTAAAAGAGLCSLGFRQVRGGELSTKEHESVERGLNYLAKVQTSGGHFGDLVPAYPVALTSLAGMAFLMSGSTMCQGKYSQNVRRIAYYLKDRARKNGLIAGQDPQEQARYTYAHGFATLFLASLYGDEEDQEQRIWLQRMLDNAVRFICNSQTTKGGWGYLAKGCVREGDDMDEGSTTVTQLQALRAARNVGTYVPKVVIDHARKYLADCTGPDGHVIYRPGRPGGRPALTAAAIACGFSMGEYQSDVVKRWLRSAHQSMGPIGQRRMGHDEYAHYYYSQAAYMLGEEGYRNLFPESRPADRLTWSGYKKDNFPAILNSQATDGSWVQGSPYGPVYLTSIYLTILQLERAALPIYQR